MATRFPGEPFSADRLPTGPPAPPGVDPVVPAIYRAAVTGADAYRATRQGLRRTGPILRLGNRFVPMAQYREIAFVALGSAAVSQALAASAALGEALTQGYVVGPDPLPREVPFRSRTLALRAATGDEDGVADEVLELARGLGPSDLLVLLLSSGSAGYLTQPPPPLSPDDWADLLAEAARRGASSRESAQIVRALGGGAAGGRLAEATRADIASLVVDRGDGADLVGGGPGRPLTPADRQGARAAVRRLHLMDRLPVPMQARVDPGAPRAIDPTPSGRPVAVATPADALRDAGDAAQAKRWHPSLAELRLEGGPEAAARHLIERTVAVRRAGPPEGAGGRAPKGLVTFAATTLDVAEGADDGPAVSRFLEAAATGLPWRDGSVVLLRTAGSAPDAPAPGAIIGAGRAGSPSAGAAIRPLRMRSGITDVGLVAAVLVPSGA
jgi:glycerate-2-kinase